MTEKIHSSTIKRKNRALLLALFLFFGIISLIPTNITRSKAGLAEWILCQEQVGAMVLELGTTDKLHYLLRSKSSVTPLHDVDSGLNGLLKIGGYKFKENNELVLGRKLVPTSIKDEIKSPNGGPGFSVWDRFGMAGTSWSTYLGEWKYYQVDPCSDSNASPSSFNQFYTNRVEPKATWSQVFSSTDPRSTHLLNQDSDSNTWITVFSNIIFSVSRFLVAFTITLVGLSFSNVAEILGITGQLTSGIFNSLWNSIYIPLLGFSILATGIRFLWIAGAKRQVREGVQGLVKVIGIFFFGLLMYSNPAMYINAPNTAATYVQSLMVNAVAQEPGGSGSLCASNIGALQDKSDLNKVSENMRSQLGCLLWEKLIYTPWHRGQFGVEPGGVDKIELRNEVSVGKPIVPLGGGKELESWAVFTLSTHTNAHSQLGDSNVNNRIDNTSVDWWRVVDAFSQYEEKTSNVTINGEQTSKTEQVIHEVHPSWNHFVGNRSSERLGIAIVNIPLAGIAVAPMLVFALLSVVYGILLIIAMVFAPVMFLFGLWSGKGEQIFLGWVQSVATLFMKKIGATLLMLFSFALVNLALDLINSLGWIQALLLLFVLVLILIQNREMLLNQLAKVNFGGTWNPMTGMKQAFDKNMSRVNTVRNIGVAGIAGGYAAFRTGQSIKTGIKVAGKEAFRNELYKTSWGTQAAVTAMSMGKEKEALKSRRCVICTTQLKEGQIAFVDSYGNTYCQRCGEESSNTDLQEIKLTKNKEMHTRSIKSTKNLSYLSHGKSAELTQFKMTDDGQVEWDKYEAVEMIKKNLTGLHLDIETHKGTSLMLGDSALTPKIPEPIEEYLDSASVNVAWEQKNYDYIMGAYKEAWKMYLNDNHKVTKEYQRSTTKGDKFLGRAFGYIDEFEVVAKEEYLDNAVADIILEFVSNKETSESEDVSEEYFVYDNGVLEVKEFMPEEDEDEDPIEEDTEFSEEDAVE